jgi:methyl-accepting chemotaxis protein
MLAYQMPADPPSQRLLRLLRRTSKSNRGAGVRSPIEDGALWSAHERALVRTRDAGSAAQRIGGTAGRYRVAVDALADRVHTASSRSSELQSSFMRVVDAFDRLGLVALNAGLEGARLGEAEGRQLALVSDEVRAQSSRGAEVARELAGALSQLTADLGQLEAQVAQAQAVVAEVTQDSARAAGAASDAEAALVDIGDRVKKATGSDPETVRAIAEASERARALVSSLSALSGKVPRTLLVGALGPVLAPLARLLSEEEPELAGEGTDVDEKGD